MILKTRTEGFGDEVKRRIMLMIHFLLLMIHFIRHSVMFAEFAKVLKIHKTKISNFESYWAAYGRLKL